MTMELWEIKYRPTEIDDYIFQTDKQKELIEKCISEGAIPHLLLNGHRGTGKTSLAYLFKEVLEIDDYDFLTLNGSDENGVDTVRNRIKGFVSTTPIGEFKIVFIDEADRLTFDAQQILRHMMEEYSDTARFILACNYGNKIIPELKSRCVELEFKSMDRDLMMERLAVILSNEKIKATVDDLTAVVDQAYPDMRKAVQLLQHSIRDGSLTAPESVDPNVEVFLGIVDLMENNQYKKIRNTLNGLDQDDFVDLYVFLYTHLEEIGKFSDESLWKRGIIVIADYLDRHLTRPHPEIIATAMFLKLSEI